MTARRIVVVGASLAGVTTADTLRADGFDGEITVLGAEVHPPYTRPPLSKGVLAGTETAESVRLTPLGSDVELRLGTPARGLDTPRHEVLLDDGERLSYDDLVIATGSRARRLATAGQRGERVLRTLEDCLALREALRARPSVLVIGAGFLGMEVASTCRSLGSEVTVIDPDPPLVRLLGPWLAGLVSEAAADAGVRIVRSDGSVTLWAPDGVVRGARTATGSLLTADVVVSAVGDVPDTGWLAGSGLNMAGGVVVDGNGAAAPGVFAAGDVTVRRDAAGRPGRTPHWTSAVHQARAVADALLGVFPRGPVPTPYFWTDAFGLAVRVCGGTPSCDDPEVLAGSRADRSVLLRWPGTAVAVNHRMPVRRLAELAAAIPA